MSKTNTRLWSLLLLFTFYTPGAYADKNETLPFSGINLEDFEKKKTGGLKWDNNPFLQPLEETSIDNLKLTAIVYHESDAAALINGQVFRQGDKIGFTEVINVQKKRVILRNANGLFDLSLKKQTDDSQT